MAYTCQHCGRAFTKKCSMDRHIASAHDQVAGYTCSVCSKEFTRVENGQLHEQKCGVAPPSRKNGAGIKRPRIRHANPPSDFRIRKTATAFSNATVTWKLDYPVNTHRVGYMDVIESSINAMESRLERFKEEQRAMKFNMSIHVVFVKAIDANIMTDPPVVLLTE